MTFTTHKLSKHNKMYNDQYYKLARKAMLYLKGSKELSLTLSGASNSQSKAKMKITAYCDSSFADCTGSKSTFGYYIFLNESPISWCSKTLPLVTMTTCESEYVTMSITLKEMIYLKQLLLELKQELDIKMQIWCDNESAVNLTKSRVISQRSKHIRLAYHFIREHVNHGDLEVSHVGTDQMIADIFTKPLQNPKFGDLRTKLGLK